MVSSNETVRNIEIGQTIVARDRLKLCSIHVANMTALEFGGVCNLELIRRYKPTHTTSHLSRLKFQPVHST
jgi:hypothetical protein